jgi:type II restriction enzyme
MRVGKVEEGQEILAALGLPPAQQTGIASYTLLALADVGKRDPWSQAKRRSIRIHAIKEFVKERHGKTYAENTRETFRRQVIHQLEQARVVDRNPDQPDLPTNSPNTHYALSEDALRVIRAYGTREFVNEAKIFTQAHGALWDVYRAARAGRLVPVTLPSGEVLKLSPGEHNEVQAAVVEEFAPRFAPGSLLLYLGDTAKKHLHIEDKLLELLRIPVTKHDKLPDVVLHMPSRNWLLLIEVVTSHGPVSPKRKHEIETMLAGSPLTRIYVSAFPNFKEFKRHVDDIAWETEVWIAEMPDHLIHFNGDKFLGPARPQP